MKLRPLALGVAVFVVCSATLLAVLIRLLHWPIQLGDLGGWVGGIGSLLPSVSRYTWADTTFMRAYRMPRMLVREPCAARREYRYVYGSGRI